ncbi:hypothetical protein [Mangrovihabitans endophyticus]|uniref:Uncharacterized protein n=1 Tax=Mangrovihabitans endophyticus TaxID=1751298 RepID=A0A8J3FNR3_9ACTN|nr:hypothetical protein [Mangrovihabitans endophyticus]GGK93417.1 hypothetical protein GCM10012284_29190 [Mangrovihabitans endophyticus]
MDRVPVTESLIRLSEDPRFWARLRSDDADALDHAPLRAVFPVTGGYALVLDVDPVTGEQSLGLRQPASSEPVQLGWTVPGRPHPAALRWHELDLCARLIALEDPTLPHPGLVVALLSAYAPARAEDDEQAIAAMREVAYRSLRRDVTPPPPCLPEQTPLPLFAAESWWPQPPVPSPHVLDEATIAAYAAPASGGPEVRADSRFPHEGLADLMRLAAGKLSRVPHDGMYSGTRPLARHIADTGDLRPVTDLLGALTEAGCDHPTVLDALSEPLVPLEACWMVETLAGAVPGTLLRRHV